jgi:hypothetical protein
MPTYTTQITHTYQQISWCNLAPDEVDVSSFTEIPDPSSRGNVNNITAKNIVIVAFYGKNFAVFYAMCCQLSLRSFLCICRVVLPVLLVSYRDSDLHRVSVVECTDCIVATPHKWTKHNFAYKIGKSLQGIKEHLKEQHINPTQERYTRIKFTFHKFKQF